MKAPSQQRIRDLQEQSRGLQRENERLRERLEAERERLQQEIERLKRELELAQRASKRRRFPKGSPKPNRSGRTQGGLRLTGATAAVAFPHRWMKPLLCRCRTLAPAAACSHEYWAHQYQTEIVRQTRVTRFRVEVGHCQHCQSRVQGRDERQSSDALGAAPRSWGSKRCRWPRC
ncbi:MAG: hypothetical protein L0387_06535 [Acidobacteria bacterium]|nr:hypothetical protein [Acidobacteriota bacterium]MCI0621311.1 hypothetical protein [Acidobacteriota bacterium]MCI0724868.1 hypothetical protein [Acidobacteriota bacterium]